MLSISPAILFLHGILLANTVPPSPAGESASQGRLLMHRRVFERVLRSYKPDAHIAVVRYKTSFTLRDVTYADGRFEKDVPCANTSYFFEGDINSEVRMDGTFALVKELQHVAPALGDVKKTIPVRAGRDDPNYHRFRPFWEASEKGQPIMALAIFESRATYVLDAELIAPIGKGDIPVFEGFFKYLQIRAPKDINVREAEALLDSPNHLLVWLGLTRLEELNTLGARHFCRAILATDSSETPSFVTEMFMQRRRNQASSSELTAHLIELIKMPSKQVQVLRELNWRLNGEANEREKSFDIGMIQQAAREYRQSNLEDLRKRPDALAELEKLISWVPKQSKP